MHYNFEISMNIINWVLSNIKHDDYNPKILGYLTSWEKKEKTPTYNQILEVSNATGIPLGYFFLDNPPKEDLSFVDYRTIDSVELQNPSRALRTTMLDMQLVQEWLHNQLLSDNSPKNVYVNSLHPNESTINLANKIRSNLNLQINWYENAKNADESFKFLRSIISDTGVTVMINGVVRNNTRKVLSINEFRAFTLIDDYAPLIFINSNDSINGKLFSLLHEYVHIGLGQNSLFNDRCNYNTKVNKTESICNAVAAEILVPQTEFINKWTRIEQQHETKDTIKSLSKYFKCGMAVIARKAFDNKFIKYELYNSIVQETIKYYKKSNSNGGDFYRTLNSRIDSNFLNYLFNSVEQGKTLYTDAFRLTNTNRKTFNTLKMNFEGGVS